MIESKGWKWEIVEAGQNGIWKTPSEYSFHIITIC